jgi:hypothetical protein
LEVEGSDFSLELLVCGQGVGDGLAPNGEFEEGEVLDDPAFGKDVSC